MILQSVIAILLDEPEHVTDIVGTYQDLQNYDTQHLNDNDIIKVLSDSTHDNQPSYYRFDKDKKLSCGAYLLLKKLLSVRFVAENSNL